MTQELISVIIPVYNAADFLQRCINSVTDSTYTCLEIICINDGSTDESLSLLNQLASQDSRIRVINQSNKGVSAARNRGLDEAVGKYVVFVDADDWVHREHFSLLYRTASKYEADMVIGGYTQTSTYNETCRYHYLPFSKDIQVDSAEFYRSGNLTSSPWCKLFKRSSIGTLRFPIGIHFGEDQIFNVSFFANLDSPCIRRVELPIYFYFDRPGSLVHNTDVNRFLLLAEHYLANIQSYKHKDIPLSHIYRTLCFYRYEGRIVGKKNVINQTSRRAFQQVRPWLLQEKSFSAKQKLKYLIAEAFPFLYRIKLLSQDPSMRAYEQFLKMRASSDVE